MIGRSIKKESENFFTTKLYTLDMSNFSKLEQLFDKLVSASTLTEKVKLGQEIIEVITHSKPFPKLTANQKRLLEEEAKESIENYIKYGASELNGILILKRHLPELLSD
jgi:hypothetical protein